MGKYFFYEWWPYFAAQFEGGRHEHRIEKMAIPCGAAGDAAK